MPADGLSCCRLANDGLGAAAAAMRQVAEPTGLGKVADAVACGQIDSGPDPTQGAMLAASRLAQQGREALDAVAGGFVEVVLDMATEVGATKGLVEVRCSTGDVGEVGHAGAGGVRQEAAELGEIGRASCRERVFEAV